MEFLLFVSPQTQKRQYEYLSKIEWKAGALLHARIGRQDFHGSFGKTAKLFFLMDDENIAGFGALVERDFHPIEGIMPWIAFVYVTVSYRGRRLSEQIVNFLEGEAAKDGHQDIHILTQHQGLYEKYGYRQERKIHSEVHPNGDYIYVKPLQIQS